MELTGSAGEAGTLAGRPPHAQITATAEVGSQVALRNSGQDIAGVTNQRDVRSGTDKKLSRK